MLQLYGAKELHRCAHLMVKGPKLYAVNNMVGEFKETNFFPLAMALCTMFLTNADAASRS